jgi:hypothetical protein
MQFKSKIVGLKNRIAKNQRNLEKVDKLEGKSRKKWAAEYGKYLTAAENLTKIKVHGTAKEADLKKKILGWPKRSTELTRSRDSSRAERKKIQEILIQLGLELARLTEQVNSECTVIDEIVTQVFSLNDTVVRAGTDREECLKRHVFPRLITSDGKLCSQVSFTSSNGLRRVVAMVNTMTIVQGDLAKQAQQEIEKFFAKFQATAMDNNTKALYELTKQILIEKTNFKVGPDLYRFLGMELDENIFPELSLAQRYLRQSIRSEKTNSYIRIYERQSSSDKWQVVPQS